MRRLTPLGLALLGLAVAVPTAAPAGPPRAGHPRPWMAPTVADEGPVHYSPASFNNHWGVPLTLARMPADARFAIRFLAEERGHGAGARKRLFELFPYGYVKQACRIAGMRRPRIWSTG